MEGAERREEGQGTCSLTRPGPGALLQMAVFLYPGCSPLGDCVSSQNFSWLGTVPFVHVPPAPQSVQSSHQGLSEEHSSSEDHPVDVAPSSPPWPPPPQPDLPGGSPATPQSNRLLTFFFTHHGYLAVLPIKLACPLALTPYSERHQICDL